MMDTFFLPHATMGKTDSTPIMEFLRSWKDVVGVPKPKSILIVSAHWDTCDPTVSVFPYIHETTYESEDSTKSHLAKFKYPAPGAPQLGMRVKELLMESGFETVHEDSSRGLDHGAWFPLMLMYPEADIPVCEISIQSSKDGIHHYNMGKAFAPLRAEGVLIIGSGGTISYVPPCIPPVHAPLLSWALEFNTWLKDSILTGRHEDVIEFEKLAPHAKMAHPRPDHIYPLIVAFASAGNGAKAQLIHHSWQRGFLCFDSYRFSENVETSF